MQIIIWIPFIGLILFLLSIYLYDVIVARTESETFFVVHQNHDGLRQFVRDIQEMLES